MQGVCSIASINLYAEEKEHFLFAYDAPMTFQIHFCLTINQSVTIIFLSCLKYQWATNHLSIFSVSFGKKEANVFNSIGSLGRSSNLLSCFHRFLFLLRLFVGILSVFFLKACWLRQEKKADNLPNNTQNLYRPIWV